MPTNKNLPPLQVSEDEIILGRGADAIRISGKDLRVKDGSTHVRGHYPDMYPWDRPHMHPEDDVRRNRACDLAFPPDNIPVAAIPAAIRELKRLAIGGWVVNAPVSEDLLAGAIVRWDSTAEMWVAALAGDLSSPTDKEDGDNSEEDGGCSCPIPPIPDTDLPADVPSAPPAEVKLPCTDFDAKLEKSPTQTYQPAFMGVVISGNGVQTHGVVRHASFNYPARTPLYLSATEPGHVTEEDTGVFVGTVLVPGVLLLNVYAQIFDNYLVLVKEELKEKIECEMKQLLGVSKTLAEAIAAGDAENAKALKDLQDFITERLQTLQSFLDNVNRQYEELLKDMEALEGKVDALGESITEDAKKGGKGHVVNTIAGRNELKDAPEGTVVFVRDASDDPAVKSGPATYILVGTGADGYWANITASIKLDAGDILGDIDLAQLQNAIAKTHSHDNKTLLDSITSFGEKGVKIGDVTIINSDGTLPGGGGTETPTPPTDTGITTTTPIPIPGSDPAKNTTLSEIAGDVADLKDVKWVIALDAMPTDDDFDEVLKNVPEGALFSVPHSGSEEPAPDVPSSGDVESLKARVVALEGAMEKVSQVIQVPNPDANVAVATEAEGATDSPSEPDTVSELVVAAHQASDSIFGAATSALYGHVRVITDTTASSFGSSDVFSAAATALLVGKMGTPGEINWPNGQVPSVGTMLDSATFLVTSSGSFTLPAGKYSFEVVGGGGKGQDGYAPFPTSTRSGAGGGSAQPVIEQVMLNAAATVAATVGASGGNSVVTVADKTITGHAGAGAAGGHATGSGTGYSGGGNGGTGPSYTHPGGAGGSGAHGTGSCDDVDYGTYDWGNCGAGGGAGSRLSRVITSVVAANGAASNNPGGGSDNNYGRGGTGYGAGGGGGGAYWSTSCGTGGSYRAATGGAGAPGCVLITARV